MKPLISNPQIEIKFDSATNCWICEKRLISDRVRDHDHFTGEYKGAAHNECNLNYSIPKKILIFFHNLENYDSHLIINALKYNTFQGELLIIRTTIEKYIGWFVDDLAFLDSFAFLPGSLDALIASLTTKEAEISRQEWVNDGLTDLSGKAALPNEYLSSLEKFNDPTFSDIDSKARKTYGAKKVSYNILVNFFENCNITRNYLDNL